MPSFTSFTPSTSAIASQVNNNFSFLDGNLTPHSSGALSDNQHGLGATSNRWAHIAVVSINAANIICSGTATFRGVVTISSSSTFNGPPTFATTATFNAPATFNSTVTMNGPVTVNGAAIFTSITSLDGGFDTGDNVGISFVIHSIGDWNMDATANVTVTHSLTLANIRLVHATVRNDADDGYADLSALISGSGVNHGGIGQTNSLTVTLERVGGGGFDSTAYNSTSFNRGWIIVWYET